MNIGNYAIRIADVFGGLNKPVKRIMAAAAFGPINKEVASFHVMMPNGQWSGKMHIGMLGDVNGDGEVNIIDVTLLRYHYQGTQLLTGAALVRGDVNRDEVTNETDHGLVTQYVIDHL